MRHIAAEDFSLLYEKFAKLAVDIFNAHKIHYPTMLALQLGDIPGSIEQAVMLDP